MKTHPVPRLWQVMTIVALVATLTGVAQGATTGQLSGYVVDDEGAPLPGVSVFASSPTQIGGIQSAETDVLGWFQYPRLNPGYFTVRLELDGFLTQELTEVQVRLDRMTQVQVTMPLATFGDEVTVTETTPVVDPQRVSTGQTFTEDFIQEATIGMDARYNHSQLILRAAGTSSTWTGGESGPSWSISVLGSTGTENVFLVDGLDTTDPYSGIAQSLIPMNAINEVAFDSAGFEAQFGRATGGVINALTKSGSNTLSGTFDARYSDNSLETSGEHYDPDEQEYSSRIVGVTLGGRFVRDRAWFFAALEDEGWAYTPTGAPTTIEQPWITGLAKVTGQATPSWLAVGKYQRNPYETLNVGSGQFRAPEATGRWDQTDTLLQAEVSGVLSQDLLWEIQVGSQSFEQDISPMSGDSSAIYHYNLMTGMSSGNYGSMSKTDRSRDQIGTNLTWFLDEAMGSHQIKLGADYQQTAYSRDGCWTGLVGGGFCRVGEPGYGFQDLSNEAGHSIPYVMRLSTNSGPYEVEGSLPSLFVQDAWRVRPDVTLQLGLRWDRSDFDNDVGQRVAEFEMLQPRIGITWNLTGNGRNLLRASWGRFMDSSVLTLPRLGTSLTTTWEYWLSCSLPGDYDGPGLSNAAECAALAESWGVPYRADPESWDPAGWLYLSTVGSTSLWQVSPDLEPTHTETLIIGFERELFRRTSLELSYVDKATRDIFDDTCIGNYPTPNSEADCSDGAIVVNLPQALRDYTAWILNFESRALDRLHVLASYTYSDTEGSTDNSNIATNDFDLYPYHFVNRYGYLSYHRQHRVKASGYVLLPLDFGFSFSGIWGSPFRWNPVQPASLIEPGLWGVVFVEPRGSREGDEWSQLDVQLTKGFTLGRVRLQLIGSILNLFDSENATDVCDRVNGCGDFELGDPIEWQKPRRYELGVRVEF